MVDFRLRDEEEKFLERFDHFVETEVMPHQREWTARAANEADVIQHDGTLDPAILALSRDIRRKSAAEGFYAMHMPEELGGAGVSRVVVMEANRRLFRRGIGLTLSALASIEGPSRMLVAMNAAQREKYVRPLVEGRATSCFGLTEPGAGSDVRNIQTTATPDGDGWQLNGVKAFITNAPYADFAVVFARTGDADAGMAALSAFVVDKDTPGFTVGPVMHTIANNGLPAELHLDNCHVGPEALIGDVGEGFWHALQNINDIRMQLGGMCIGMSQFCLDRTLAYVNQRQAFGKPIGKFQGISFPLADCATEIEAAHTLALKAAWTIDQDEDALQLTSMTKLFATELLWNVSDRCIQAHGGQGVLRENELERVSRWARLMRIWEGSSEIQRQTIAKTLGI